jgi:vacuolar-type H+-ATPase subunit I/STV1
MSSSAISDFFNVDWQAVLTGFIILLSFFVTICTLLKSVCKTLGIKFTFLEDTHKDHDTLMLLQEDVQKLDQRLDNMENYYKESREESQQLLKKLVGLEERYDRMQVGLKQILANAAEQRIREYYSLGYIPEAEFDSFCDLLEYATQEVHCNHGLDQKYRNCKDSLKILSSQEAMEFIINKNKEEKS